MVPEGNLAVYRPAVLEDDGLSETQRREQSCSEQAHQKDGEKHAAHCQECSGPNTSLGRADYSCFIVPPVSSRRNPAEFPVGLGGGISVPDRDFAAAVTPA